MASRAERAEFWLDHVEGWRRSGQTQAAYCTEQGLSVNSLAYWLRRLRQDPLRQDSCPLKPI